MVEYRTDHWATLDEYKDWFRRNWWGPDWGLAMNLAWHAQREAEYKRLTAHREKTDG